MKYYMGIDIGGTNITAGIITERKKMLLQDKVKTYPKRPWKEIVFDIISLCERIIVQANLTPKNISGIGIGCPGTCNRTTGVVEYANNLGWVDVPLRDCIQSHFGVKTVLDNDANAAAYGEFMAGAARGTKNAVIITLGTGVGAGIIINKRIYNGSNFAGGEIGHMVISENGPPCTCGRNGCFEVFSSASALVRITKERMQQKSASSLREYADQDGKISARTAFRAARAGDPEGQAVVQYYIKMLACGIANTINIFQPDILCIGGGVCNEGDYLLIPLIEQVNENLYTKNSGKSAKIVICELGSAAGVIGAALLGKMKG